MRGRASPLGEVSGQTRMMELEHICCLAPDCGTMQITGGTIILSFCMFAKEYHSVRVTKYLR
jgi:hypothetical protein